MTSERLLVLGASVHQLDSILAARRLGFEVITTDNVPENPGHKMSDSAFDVDITDKESILRLCVELDVCGIIAACTDVGVPTAAFVGHKLGLKTPPWPSSSRLTNKISFRKLQEKLQLAHPAYFVLDGSNPATQPPPLTWGEWIIKPADSAGSKGVYIFSSLDELQHCKNEAISYSSTKECIVEQNISGLQGTCEGIIHNGSIVWHIIMDRKTLRSPYASTTGLRLPSGFSKSSQEKLIEGIQKVSAYLGLNDCVFDCDFIAGEDVYLLELSPRLGGNGISRLIRHATGVDLASYAVQLAMNKCPDIPIMREPRPTESFIFGCSKTGILSYDESGLDWANSCSWVHDAELSFSPGDRVERFRNGRHAIGGAVISADTSEQLQARANQLNRKLNIETAEETPFNQPNPSRIKQNT